MVGERVHSTAPVRLRPLRSGHSWHAASPRRDRRGHPDRASWVGISPLASASVDGRPPSRGASGSAADSGSGVARTLSMRLPSSDDLQAPTFPGGDVARARAAAEQPHHHSRERVIAAFLFLGDTLDPQPVTSARGSESNRRQPGAVLALHGPGFLGALGRSSPVTDSIMSCKGDQALDPTVFVDHEDR